MFTSTTYKITIGHKPFQLVYSLHPFMFMEYLFPTLAMTKTIITNPMGTNQLNFRVGKIGQDQTRNSRY
jgi:hypothetical protein